MGGTSQGTQSHLSGFQMPSDDENIVTSRATSNPNKTKHNLRAISTQIEIISTARGVVTENSSDLDSGRRPELESDEFSVTTPLVVEILGREVDTFPQTVFHYWDFGSWRASCTRLWWGAVAD